MRHLRLYEEIDVNFKFKKGDYVKKISPEKGTIYIIDWIFLNYGKKAYGVQFVTGELAGEDAGFEFESNLREPENWEIEAINYNL